MILLCSQPQSDQSYFMTRLFSAAALLGCTVLLASCGEPSVPSPLPEGLREVSGVLFPAGISIVRRGSHVLMQEESPLYYVESSKVNLRSHEQKQVKLIGVLEYNIDPFDLPVFVVESIELPEEDVDSWSFPQFGLKFSAPREWQSSPAEEEVYFFVEGSDKPILSIFTEQSNDGRAKEGFPVVIGGKSAMRDIDEETGSETVRFGRDEEVIVLLFTPREHPRSAELKSQWLSVLRTLTLDGGGDSATKVPPTGTGSGVPCGGTAGILCPAGYFCDVQNLQENIGVCKKL